MSDPGVTSVSVIIPCFNAGGYLREAVASVLAQKSRFELLEVIVVDDRSDDPPTIAVLAELREQSLVRILRNAGKKGAASARNTGLATARGAWIAFLDADDILLEGAFATFEAGLKLFPDCRWIGADYYWLSEDGIREENSFYSSRPLPQRRFADAFASARPIRLKRPVVPFLEACLSKIGACLIGRDLLTLVGPADPDLKMAEDHQLFMRMAAVSDYVFVPTPVLHYRRHKMNTTAALHSRMEPPGLWPHRALELLLDRYNMRDYRRDIHRQMAAFAVLDSVFYRQNGNFWLGSRCAVRAIRHNPTSIASWHSLAAALLGR